MSSVSSVNPGLENLLQTLATINSPVLSSPAAVAALEKAPPSDIVQLSVSAEQLEGMDALFGIADATSAADSSLGAPSNVMAQSGGSAAGALQTPAGAQPAASSAEQLAGSQEAFETGQTEALFGAPTSSAPANSLFDLTG